MDAAIADTINRLDAARIAKHLDLLDWFNQAHIPWHVCVVADTLMGTNATSNADRAWLVGVLAARTPDVLFDGAPADCDWDNLFGHIRSEIQARRDPKLPHAETATTQLGVVV